MLPVGAIVDLYCHKNNIIIPFGFLRCNGQSINEDNFTELYYHLNGTDDEIQLPNLPLIELGDYVIVKIIKISDDSDDLDNIEVGNAEFIVK